MSRGGLTLLESHHDPESGRLPEAEGRTGHIGCGGDWARLGSPTAAPGAGRWRLVKDSIIGQAQRNRYSGTPGCRPRSSRCLARPIKIDGIPARECTGRFS